MSNSENDGPKDTKKNESGEVASDYNKFVSHPRKR